MTRFAVRSCGVAVQVRCADHRLDARVRAVLPANATPCGYANGVPTFGLSEGWRGGCNLTLDGRLIAVNVTPGIALAILDSEVRACVALHARDHVIVHAGAFAHRGRGIVIPGPSFAGKTTLVAALLAAGASYLSDELAVIDRAGCSTPSRDPSRSATPRPRSPRGSRPASSPPTRAPASELAPHAPPSPADPVPIGLIVIATYQPGASWEPRELTPGEGVLALLANTPAGRTRAGRILPILGRATRHARVLHGLRGEACDAAGALPAATA